MDALETRELVYFVAVAEELHFGRAAERLGIAQPPLSRAIQRLERRMEVTLLERTSRAVSLTPAGTVFLAECHKALDAVTAAQRRAQRAGQDVPRLKVAMKPEGDAGLLERILPAYRQDPDAVDVHVEVCGAGEQSRMLRDGRVDLALLHAPHDDLTGFDTEALLTLNQVAVLARGHRLAEHTALALADLDSETFPRFPGDDPVQATGPEVRDIGQLMQLVALGRVVAVVPESVRRHARSDVVCVPVLDAPSSSVLLAWPERTHSRAVAAFVRASTEAAATAPAV
ncbi:DNA-binding transcriptional LysR family regulator [Haloactinopolyspora alba]|uniref:DNA-binding transcriptional LysR family regulator n=1 Tax=Haloactinopolyspora alba TaxID=648780 RepID=A0A2P8EF43_9ACTN|nr:LysR substrate-binding domain-containing protein [Haloactinopolyspora alba]PSL08071.1 DNA-binding transcriptional LysR family regulator [Haloactinopolyspora alba]